MQLPLLSKIQMVSTFRPSAPEALTALWQPGSQLSFQTKGFTIMNRHLSRLHHMIIWGDHMMHACRILSAWRVRL